MPYYDMAESLREEKYLHQLITDLEKNRMDDTEYINETLLSDEIERIKKAGTRHILIFGKHAEIYISVQTRLILHLDIRLIDHLRTLKARYSVAYQQKDLILQCELLHDELLRLVCFYEQLIDTMIK
ncbi:hypothetical protein N180_14475 [Pedobacter antarcticus 4BY]|uniref:Uncharacterized protein n=3 Tax=Pedobacter antarcticus TaxID=34086 RepID=A0A081PLX7_9SPHI|nr:hypothetical protein [Pedobacter antarcticus]KEQ31700.1 hypothetical protein N180_14475 [Pedobacter antarcticus 4BY]SFE34789.1 hypothetical protein SAMN03003324_00164 [Pedobacter antarcticus]